MILISANNRTYQHHSYFWIMVHHFLLISSIHFNSLLFLSTQFIISLHLPLSIFFKKKSILSLIQTIWDRRSILFEKTKKV